MQVNKRIDEWASQCGSKVQHLRGYWPGIPGDNQPDAMGRVKEGRPGKFCHLLERLIHVELADLVQNKQYLVADFPDVMLSEEKSVKSPPKEKCADCEKFVLDTSFLPDMIFQAGIVTRRFSLYRGRRARSSTRKSTSYS